MKQIADMIGISKMTVYRFIKANHIKETSQVGRTLLYDDRFCCKVLNLLSNKIE